ncbi:hypothetical protein, partial [Halorubrum sp. F4]|uniref:hypothetical protein n=1 Tax=Halorubrum sp. F4 TaxID=2989715 RepID=UPI00247FDCFD
MAFLPRTPLTVTAFIDRTAFSTVLDTIVHEGFQSRGVTGVACRILRGFCCHFSVTGWIGTDVYLHRIIENHRRATVRTILEVIDLLSLSAVRAFVERPPVNTNHFRGLPFDRLTLTFPALEVLESPFFRCDGMWFESL